MSAQTEDGSRLLALVVGIDAYPFVVANPLQGCVNDARRMATVLTEQFGARVTMLLDERATRDAILDELARLLDAVRPHDRVAFHFSGHGSRIRSRAGVRMETLVPHDSGRDPHPNCDILDRELENWLRTLRATTTAIALIFDSCHAGGMTRDLEASFRSVEPDARPGAAGGKNAFGVEGATREARPADGPSGWISPSGGHTLIAACRAGERASELRDLDTGLMHGALTRFLAEELTLTTTGDTYRDVFEPVARRVTSRFRGQRPQLEGAWDREVFGAREVRAERWVPVERRDGLEAWLKVGAAHGVAVGSEWQVYPAAGRGGIGEEVLGRLRIVEVEPVRARARVVEEVRRWAVAAGDRGVEVARPTGAGRLTVGVVPAWGEVRRAIEDSPWLASTPAPEDAEVLVRRLEARQRAGIAAVPPELGTLEAAAWVASDRAGALLMPPIPASGEGVSDLLRSNLEVWARHRALCDLRNRSLSRHPGDLLEVQLLRRRPGGAWEDAPLCPDGCGHYHEGDSLGVRLRHSHVRPLHLGLLDLGLTGAVRLLHPVRGAIEPWPAGCWLEVGLEEPERLELFVPDSVPSTGEPFEGGKESLLVIATEEPTDLGSLEQDGVADRPGGERRSALPVAAVIGGRLDDLREILLLSSVSAGSRDARPAGEGQGGFWAARCQTLWLTPGREVER